MKSDRLKAGGFNLGYGNEDEASVQSVGAVSNRDRNPVCRMGGGAPQRATDMKSQRRTATHHNADIARWVTAHGQNHKGFQLQTECASTHPTGGIQRYGFHNGARFRHKKREPEGSLFP
jgi:hypothetical protein